MNIKALNKCQILILITLLTLSANPIPHTKSINTTQDTANEQTQLPSNQPPINSKPLNNENNIAIQQHRITPTDLNRLKDIATTWQEGKNYNLKVDSHGTGLVPPTEEEWSTISQTAFITDNITLPTQTETPSTVDHSTEPWFPPIGNQDGKGSCTAWAVAYYMKTYQEASEHEWDLSAAMWEGGYYGHPTPSYQDKIFSPDFVYNLINNGLDEGSSFYDAINLICSIGAATWTTMPYNPSDPTSWPSEQAWKEAPQYRANSSGYQTMLIDTDNDLQSLKNWLASDHLAVIAVDADKYSSLTSEDVWTLDNYMNPVENHANTIVGYSDNLTYTEDGEVRHGAFKIANSWGIGHWEQVPDGCYWISYETMKQQIGEVMFYYDMIGYEPTLTATFNIDHAKRGECAITVGMGEKDHPIKTKRFDRYINGGDFPFCSNDIILDITEFKTAVPTLDNQSFYLKVYDGDSSTTGTITKFMVNHAESADPPVDTINGGNVYVYTRLGLTGILRVLPENVDLGSGYVTGQNFTIAVVVEQMTDLYSLSFEFCWNTTYFKYINHTVTMPIEDYPNPIPPSPYAGTLSSPVIKIRENVNGSRGIFSIAYNSTPPASGFDGNGTVFTMTLSVTFQSDSQVNIPLIIANCTVSDSSGAPLMVESRNGSVIVPPLPPDTTSPLIGILSPENKTYSIDNCPLTFNVSEPASAIQYGLDDQVNITIAGNTTLMSLLEGEHSLVVYATDMHGNVGESETVFFIVDMTPPLIANVTEPPEIILPGTAFEVNATVEDSLSELRQVLLNFTCFNDTSVSNHIVNMTRLTETVWNGTIHSLTSGTNVTYTVIAEDSVGNRASSESFTYQCQSPQVPEISSILIAVLLLAEVLLCLVIDKRRARLFPNHFV